MDTVTLNNGQRNYLAKVLDEECKNILNAIDRSDRYNKIFAAACKTGGFVLTGELDEQTWVDRLDEAVYQSQKDCEKRKQSYRDVQRILERALDHYCRPRYTPKSFSVKKELITKDIMVWFGRVYSDCKNATTLKICAGVARLCMDHGKSELEESYAQIALASGVAKSTITKHMHKLKKYLMIERVSIEGREGERTTRWAPRTRGNDLVFQQGPPLHVRVFPDDLGSPEADCWFASSALWLTHLNEQMNAPQDHCSKRTLRRHKARMKAFGLADGLHPTQVACFPYYEARKKRYAQDTQRYRDFLAYVREQKILRVERVKDKMRAKANAPKKEMIPLRLRSHGTL